MPAGWRVVPMPELVLEQPSERDDLGAFVARAVRLDADCVVRLRARTGDAAESPLIDAWLATPFDVLATRTVGGVVNPADVTVSGNELLAALAVVGGKRVNPGPVRDLLWRSPLPPAQGWQLIDELPVAVVAELADQGIEVARRNSGPHGAPPSALLDQSVLTVQGVDAEVAIPLRCLFALSGMGFLGSGKGDESTENGTMVRITATDSWLRMDAHYGAVIRRRHALLPLLL